ncbi:hypothetical protein SNOG_11002 [Parastagonospora nodorum SN15]|uniref:Luciferase-like domain-containing protein n=1 Tax=Phaeosphaeria nodorum (strain SN15 / ATCC MYA-4574 / FGSC 10173) TaxID=321614 RepID=Q0UB62_PHANO|nr:hypothetical protein SNOG_11002 [Parastagonospora nodorum SN15]EAT81501.2 hypothetical protein SNOG_11002 [Parastagonospora nodorum SN15]
MAKRKRTNGTSVSKNAKPRNGDATGSNATAGKKVIINAFVEMCSGHQSPGLWRHPDDRSHEFNNVDHWVELAKMLEDAKIHGIFIADVLGGYDVYNGTLDAAQISGAQWPVNEPLAVVSAMAAATKSIGFGVTVSTTYEQPYHLARRLSTVDHLSKGSYLDSAARNMSMKEQLPVKHRRNSRNRIFPSSAEMAKNIKVLALVTPILGKTEEEAQSKLAEYRRYASLEGALALFCGWTGIDLGKYGDEEELRQVESNAVRSTVEGYARFSPGTSKWTKHTVAEHVSVGGNGPIFVGTPAQVADGFQAWIDEADVDGFNISFKDVIELLLPELRARGMFWDDYAVPNGTYRENFYAKKGQTGPLDEHVASKYRWKAGVAAEDHLIPE